MYCIYVWRPLMEASSTLENIRPPVVSRWSQKVNNCLRLQSQNILLHLLLKYRPDSTSSGHTLFLTVSLNFKSILHFEKLINDLTKSHCFRQIYTMYILW